MRNRSGIQGVASSPVIVGAVTVLVVIVAVFLAYNANNGLPFVSTYNLKARVPNANALVKGNEVRIGGSRVGVVKEVKPVQIGNGARRRRTRPQPRQGRRTDPGQLDDDHPAQIAARPQVPADRPRRLHEGPGGGRNDPALRRPARTGRHRPVLRHVRRKDAARRSSATTPASATPSPAAARRSTPPSAPCAAWPNTASRCCARWSTRAPTSAASGKRWRTSPPPSPRSPRRRRACSSPSTAPSPPSPASRGPSSRKRSSKVRRRSTRVTADLPALRPFFRDSGRFFTAFKPGARALGETSPTINAALRAGIPALNRSPVALRAADRRPRKRCSTSRASPASSTASTCSPTPTKSSLPAIKYIAPAQTTCNYLSLVFRNLADAFSESNGNGNWLGAIAFEAPDGPNAESAPVVGARQRSRKARTTSTSTPIRRPARTASAKPATSATRPGKTVIGHSPKLWGTTTREGEG